MTDEAFIRRTLKLAQRGRGYVSPNPMVGAIIVKDGQIIGRGYHRRFGGEHAEVEAIKAVRQRSTDTASDNLLSGSTLYVNLEPCTHHGKQPPCVEAIVKSGIKRVVVGTLDANPQVHGQGIRFLKNHGVEVAHGILQDACYELNAGFFKHIKTGLPYVTLKIAQSLDGRITAADGSSQWISSMASRRYTHRMRSECDAILAGIGTVLSDDPELNVRLVKGPQPRRVVLDSRLRMPLSARLLNDSQAKRSIIASVDSNDDKKLEKIRQIESRGAEVWLLPQDKEGRVELMSLCRRLGENGVTSLLVEGGAQIFSAFLRAGLVDKLAVFIAPKILGAGLCALQDLGIETISQSLQLTEFRNTRVGEDVLVVGKVDNTA